MKGKTMGMPSPSNVSTKRQRIAELARQAPDMAFTSLSHHIDLDWLKEAYRLTRKDGAVGVDGCTAAEYEKNLEGNLSTLLKRAKSGTYKAPPVRRAHIPKRGGSAEHRPIGVPTLEDKVLQRAVVMILGCIYEQDFLDCSYGFRPGRSPHDALAVLRKQLKQMGGGWVVELDIRGFFDTMSHGLLREMLRKRVRDGVLLCLIGKWLNAGVMEHGAVTYPETGSPQGGVVSPVLSNVYLHEVLDTWFEEIVKPRLKGRGFLVRFADDAVLGFSCEEDARRVLAVLPKRFEKYGLFLHPEKTRMLSFRKPNRNTERPRGQSFDFLGFTWYWGKTWKGYWVIKQRTAKDRMSTKLREISQWCREVRHMRISEQHKGLVRKLRGHYQYYGMPGNSPALNRFYFHARRAWQKWLARRSNRANRRWDWFAQMTRRYPLPKPRLSQSALRCVAKTVA